jgi:hypothetical protein
MAEDRQITVSEFLMWIEGIEEMSEDDWSPNPSQWKKIRQKINTMVNVPYNPQPIVMYRDSANQPPLQSNQVAVIEQPKELIVRREHSGLSTVQPAVSNNNPLFANADNPTSPVRTPNIDTSDGSGYKPAFL